VERPNARRRYNPVAEEAWQPRRLAAAGADLLVRSAQQSKTGPNHDRARADPAKAIALRRPPPPRFIRNSRLARHLAAKAAFDPKRPADADMLRPLEYAALAAA
jgi:hypothetical protein